MPRFPPNMCCLTHFLGETADPGRETKIAAYLRRIQAAHGGWPLVADGEFDMSASVKAYFALKMIGDSPSAESHAARARGNSCPWRCRRQQRLHAHPACPLRRSALALRARHARRDHAAAELVPVSSRQDLILGEDGHRTAADSSGLQTCGAQSAGHAHRRNFHPAAGAGAPAPTRRRTRNGYGSGSSTPSTPSCAALSLSCHRVRAGAQSRRR